MVRISLALIVTHKMIKQSPYKEGMLKMVNTAEEKVYDKFWFTTTCAPYRGLENFLETLKAYLFKRYPQKAKSE